MNADEYIKKLQEEREQLKKQRRRDIIILHISQGLLFVALIIRLVKHFMK